MEIKKIHEWQQVPIDDEPGAFDRNYWWSEFINNMDIPMGVAPEENEIPSDDILIKLYPHIEDSRLRKVEFRKEWLQRSQSQDLKKKIDTEQKGKNIDDLEIKQIITQIGDMIKNEMKSGSKKFRHELELLIDSFPELKNVINPDADVIGSSGIQENILKFSEYKKP